MGALLREIWLGCSALLAICSETYTSEVVQEVNQFTSCGL